MKKLLFNTLLFMCMTFLGHSQSSIGMVTPFSISDENGSAFIGDLMISDESGFVNSIVITAQQGTVVSIDDINSEAHITIFPNPSSETIQIDTDIHVELVEIYDARGQMIQSTTASQIDITELPNGVYHLAINKESSLTFIKQ